MFELARIADEYGNGELRITVEQNLTLPNVPSAKVDKLMKESLSEKCSPTPAGEYGGVHGQSILRTSHLPRAKPAPWSARWSWIPPWKPAPFSCISLDVPTLALKFRLRILDSWERWHETRIGSPWKASTFILGGALTLTCIWENWSAVV